MNVVFTLHTPRPEGKRIAIRVVIRHGGFTISRGVGRESCRLSDWNFKRQRVNATGEDFRRINAKIDRISREIADKVVLLETTGRLNRGTISAMLDEVITGRSRKEIPTFTEFYDEWSRSTRSSERNRRATLSLLTRYSGSHLDYSTFTYEWYTRFMGWMTRAGYSANYRGTIIKRVKTVLRSGQMKGYHNNDDYLKFRVEDEEVDTVYLSAEELDRLSAVTVEPGSLEDRARDLFFLGVDTAARYSDYSKLDEAHIHDGIITFIQEKTKSSVMIPASSRVLHILAKWGGRAPVCSQQHLNKIIKSLCFRAGINTLCSKVVNEGGMKKIVTFEKWKMISTHTARRTGATLMYLAGFSPLEIMSITGHRKIETLLRYIRVTKEQQALRMRENPYFK